MKEKKFTVRQLAACALVAALYAAVTIKDTPPTTQAAMASISQPCP